jgi:hypothetical protein
MPKPTLCKLIVVALELRRAKIAKAEAFAALFIVNDLNDTVDGQACSSDREHESHNLSAQLHVEIQ